MNIYLTERQLENYDFYHSYSKNHNSSKYLINLYNQISNLISNPFDSNKSIAITSGCYDPIHLGHIKFFKAIKKEYDLLILLLNTDDYLEKIKHRTSLIDEYDRLGILKSIKYIDDVFIYRADPLSSILYEIECFVHRIITKFYNMKIDYVKGIDYAYSNIYPYTIIDSGYGIHSSGFKWIKSLELGNTKQVS